ncbi:hypothetical protein QBC46DRAFT_358653 [Diplogelasinospora grovesii]|uniref:Uncharacterized protein n=1 Tax=Diplogelasinospora grovesii TaxID=303347 RepID=A0AAN6RZG5_9PEZI|nr:hypothetical protein QBC46DRAFT_358653 [Diplogelasinospora grovesii]
MSKCGWENTEQGRRSCRVQLATGLQFSFPLATLPPPSTGLVLKHVALGRGTQYYTYDIANPSPQPNGAVATLYDAGCLAAEQELQQIPDLLSEVSASSLRFSVKTISKDLTGLRDRLDLTSNSFSVSGKHFTTISTPFFELEKNQGSVSCTKINSMPAPAPSPGSPGVGDNKSLNGETAVAWLKLLGVAGLTGGLHEVYRLDTSGGSPPPTCAGQPASLEVQYAAVYWFWGELVQ